MGKLDNLILKIHLPTMLLVDTHDDLGWTVDTNLLEHLQGGRFEQIQLAHFQEIYVLSWDDRS